MLQLAKHRGCQVFGNLVLGLAHQQSMLDHLLPHRHHRVITTTTTNTNTSGPGHLVLVLDVPVSRLVARLEEDISTLDIEGYLDATYIVILAHQLSEVGSRPNHLLEALAQA